MDTQTYVEYEVCDPVSDRRLVTESREEALAYFEKGWFVYEHHVTICRASKYSSTRLDVSAVWNGNPELMQ